MFKLGRWRAIDQRKIHIVAFVDPAVFFGVVGLDFFEGVGLGHFL